MKRILVLSDLHVGSIFSIMPDEVYIEADDKERSNRISANPIQLALWQKWQEMLDNIGRVDGCFILGDCIDGPNYKSKGFDLWTSNLHQQCATAADLLSMVKTRRYYGVQGSYYHVGENTSSDLAVTQAVKGEFGSDLAFNKWGVRIHLCHEIGWSGAAGSKSTALQGEIVGALLNAKYWGDFDLFVRGHRHEWGILKNPWGHILVAPGWKSRDAYGAKKGMKSAPGFCGYSTIEITGSSITTDVHSFVLAPDQVIKEVTT